MCKACELRGKTWSGSDPICGFETSNYFDADNWNCATLNRLRDIAERRGTISIIEDTSLAVLPIMAEDLDGWIVLSWYKSRGRTSSARFMFDMTDIPLTIEIAELALKQYDKE